MLKIELDTTHVIQAIIYIRNEIFLSFISKVKINIPIAL